jgi:hypothetical protein
MQGKALEAGALGEEKRQLRSVPAEASTDSCRELESKALEAADPEKQQSNVASRLPMEKPAATICSRVG